MKVKLSYSFYHRGISTGCEVIKWTKHCWIACIRFYYILIINFTNSCIDTRIIKNICLGGGSLQTYRAGWVHTSQYRFLMIQQRYKMPKHRCSGWLFHIVPIHLLYHDLGLIKSAWNLSGAARLYYNPTNTTAVVLEFSGRLTEIGEY